MSWAQWTPGRNGVLVLTCSIALTFQLGYASPKISSEPPPVLVITSPHEPNTVAVTGNDKLSQSLRWDMKTATLAAYVTYSEISGSGETELDPSNYKTYIAPFPSVSLDTKYRLYADDVPNKKIIIGHLEFGVFGPKVVLNRNVIFNAHRIDGRLVANILVNKE